MRRTELVLIVGLAGLAIFNIGSAMTQAGALPILERITSTKPPEVERVAVKLSGRSANPAPEAWDLMEGGLPPGVDAATTGNFGGPERWVRNVSQPTLEPFLPDAGKATGAAMIVVPGGGLLGLAIDREGFAVARWLNQRGIAAFVLKYRVAALPADPKEALSELNRRIGEMVRQIRPGSATENEILLPLQREAMAAAQQDGLEAMRYVRAHAAQWKLSPRRIGIMGFSSGAAIAIGVALKADAASRPDLVVPIYGLMPDATAVPATVAPAFIAAAADDFAASFSFNIYNAWRAAGATAELHILENGGHDFGLLRQGKSSDQWPELFNHWLAAHGFETTPPVK